jgi:hypothetical protein
LLGFFKVEAELFVACSRAVFSDQTVAASVHILHVAPPNFFVVLLAQETVQTHLSQVFNQDVSAFFLAKKGERVIGGAVLAVDQTLRLLEINGALRTGPRDEAWHEVDAVAQIFCVLFELFNEVQGRVIVRRVP